MNTQLIETIIFQLAIPFLLSKGHSKNFLPSLTLISFQVKATDADEGINGELTYELPLGIAEDKFRVDSRTGRITTTGPLDRESKSLYSLMVRLRESMYRILLCSGSVRKCFNGISTVDSEGKCSRRK